MNSFPLLEFEFFNEKIKWYPFDYLVKPKGYDDYYCIGIKTLEKVTLGSLFMKNYLVQFDVENQNISFQRKNCSNDPFYKQYFENS